MLQAINNILAEFNIREKIVTVVTDNAASMKKTADDLRIRHLPCFAHSLNLTVHDSFKIPSFAKILCACKAIVTFFRSSTLASDTLRRIQKRSQKPELKLIQEVETRWNSSFYMLKRIFEVRTELAVAISECPRAPPQLSAETFQAIEEILQVLEPFEVATATISAEKYVTSSLIIPITRGILTKLIDFEEKLVTIEAVEVLKSLTSSVKTRLKPYTTRTATILATILDPRFKKFGFLLQTDADNAIQKLQTEYASWIAGQATAPSQADLPPRPPIAQASASRSKIDDLLYLPEQSPVVTTPVSDAIIHIRQYIEKPRLERHSCPLAYWEKSCNQLKDLAFKYLSIPATSVPSERIFSKAGDIMTKKRSRIKDKNLNMLMFIKQNHDL